MSEEARFRYIANYHPTVDHVDLEALRSRNIRLGYTPSALTDAVADLAVMLALMAQRLGGEVICLTLSTSSHEIDNTLTQAMRRVIDGDWPQMPWAPMLLAGPQITNSTIGFLGFGRIAQATLSRLLPFQIKDALYLTSRPGQPAKEDFYGLLKDQKVSIQPASDWKQLAAESDVLFVGCALNEKTKHAVNAEFFGRMKKRAVIVNIARGYAT